MIESCILGRKRRLVLLAMNGMDGRDESEGERKAASIIKAFESRIEVGRTEHAKIVFSQYLVPVKARFGSLCPD